MTMLDDEHTEGKAQRRDARQRVYDLCRTFGHSWDVYEARKSPGGFDVAIRCERCSTERVDKVSRHGDIERRRYTYQDGYRSSEPTSRTEWRMMFLRRYK